jgi:hypothetical protein
MWKVQITLFTKKLLWKRLETSDFYFQCAQKLFHLLIIQIMLLLRLNYRVIKITQWKLLDSEHS